MPQQMRRNQDELHRTAKTENTNQDKKRDDTGFPVTFWLHTENVRFSNKPKEALRLANFPLRQHYFPKTQSSLLPSRPPPPPSLTANYTTHPTQTKAPLLKQPSLLQVLQFGL